MAFCLRAFFRNIAVIGRKNLQIDGPIIFVSNHPNGFLDPLILLTAQRPKLFFIAGAEWFGKGLKNYIFSKQFNMIPVVRPWLKTGEKVSNDEMFDACYQALAAGKRIVIYPEGTSVTVSRIRELKTGAIRIKEGGDAYLSRIASSYSEVKIIPVGMNYYNPRTFQSDVILNVGEPIDFSDITEQDPTERVRLMTERTREKMSELVFHFEEEDFTELARQLYRLYGAYIQHEYEVSDKDLTGKFLLQKGILDAVHYFKKFDQKIYEKIGGEVEDLSNDLNKHKLDLRYLTQKRFPAFLLIRLLLGTPFFLIGTLFNIIPYKVTRWFFETKLRPKIATDYIPGRLNPSFVGSLIFLVGMGIFTIWYILVMVVLVLITGWWILAPVLIIVGHTTGLYATRYLRLAFDLYQQILVVNRRRKRPEAFDKILTKWKNLYTQLENLRQQYESR